LPGELAVLQPEAGQAEQLVLVVQLGQVRAQVGPEPAVELVVLQLEAGQAEQLVLVVQLGQVRAQVDSEPVVEVAALGRSGHQQHVAGRAELDQQELGHWILGQQKQGELRC
jgi:hypothetical protein